jgi:hypothetical protein
MTNLYYGGTRIAGMAYKLYIGSILELLALFHFAFLDLSLALIKVNNGDLP